MSIAYREKEKKRSEKHLSDILPTNLSVIGLYSYILLTFLLLPIDKKLRQAYTAVIMAVESRQRIQQKLPEGIALQTSNLVFLGEKPHDQDTVTDVFEDTEGRLTFSVSRARQQPLEVSSLNEHHFLLKTTGKLKDVIAAASDNHSWNPDQYGFEIDLEGDIEKTPRTLGPVDIFDAKAKNTKPISISMHTDF